MPQMIFVNMSTKDLEKSKAFFEALGWQINPQFTDEKAASIVIKEGEIYAMILTEEFYKTFTHGKEIIDAHKAAEMSCALAMESREAVDALMERALAAGGKDFSKEEHGEWMYSRGFEDLDGHVWEPFYMDMAKVPANPGAAA